MTRAARSIVCFGEALIDMLALPPTPGAARSFAQFAGGAPANVAVAAARLGAPAQFVGMFGQDLFADFLIDSLHRAGVGTGFIVRTDAANTALAFVALDAHGERSFSFYRPPSADLLFRAQHFEASCLDAARVFHVCSNSLTEDAIAATTFEGMQRARAAGALISADLNLRPALWPVGVDPLPRAWQLLENADLVKLAQDELGFLAANGDGERAVLERLLAARARLVTITHGAAPVRWYTRAAAGEIPAFRVRAIDTTAAGDAFVGGLLSALHAADVDARTFDAWLGNTNALQVALRFASATGALCVTRNGAFESMPTRAEVEQLLEQQRDHAPV